MTRGLRRRCRGQRGDAGPLEVVILVPVVLALVGLVVAFGRSTTASTDVSYAATVGARAASQAQTASAAVANATAVVEETLAGSELTCVSHSIQVDASDLRPGGRVTVSVSCVVSLADLVHLAALPGWKTYSATASEVVDQHRGGEQ